MLFEQLEVAVQTFTRGRITIQFSITGRQVYLKCDRGIIIAGNWEKYVYARPAHTGSIVLSSRVKVSQKCQVSKAKPADVQS